jgi:lipopolysaccharide transport system ATP-binding protein
MANDQSYSQPAIAIAGVSKCHLIFERPEDRLKQILLPRIQRLLGARQQQYFKEFWALKEVSLAIAKGETVGIIGRNGAGKSTLLQIICGTLAPTSGAVNAVGRIAALLELGSGFNPEFTGRENVYFNATVLGLTKQEIDLRFPEIEAFAGIGEFIDRPVKTYSSGMFVRLAFAVVAHVDADILVIDEALAVGDAVFTQKCMRFLRQFKESGTLIFVSHDIYSVLNLCERAIWLDRGQVRLVGGAKEVAESYIQHTMQEVSGTDDFAETVGHRSLEPAPTAQPDSSDTPGTAVPDTERPEITLFNNLVDSPGWQTGGARISDVRLFHVGGGKDGVYRGGDLVQLDIEANVATELFSPIIGFAVKDRLGQWLFGENTFGQGAEISGVKSGEILKGSFQFSLPMLPSGNYSITIAIAEGTPFQNVQHHWLHEAVIFSVVSPKAWLGLMGIPFNSITLTKIHPKDTRRYA